ncbi:undecaprenyl-diphosphate phosphatase [Nakamurella leprariae]|uniref:Undecaprenyl-diphosphatase n=1 Tax=Nakamurella leprariae TaxID=2803911 RepID=A0A938Y864_9ACTN|nr:undecaprenyl-diphosphate phosphatase [Nakamurella leprariae]MBM9467806.1 undecaprenyl-diphosphate phosphatase [Nakamurella leprariae]
MGWFDAVLLGLTQGLTEFLPISSSAHLSIVGQLIGSQDPGAAFTAITQLGTEIAVLVYFRADIVRIALAWCRSLVGRVPRDHADVRMGWLVILGSVPIVVAGLLFQDQIETTLRNLWITVAMLAGFGLVIGWIDARARTDRTLEQLTVPHGLLFGLAQCLALVPGVSRSGGTIAAGLAMGYTREAAARYSFLLAIPAVLGSGVYQLTQIADDPVRPPWGPIAVATVVSFGVGYAVIAWLLRYVSTHSFRPFVIYRLALAAVVAGLLLAGVLQPRV